MGDALGFTALAAAVAGANWLWHLRRHPFGKCRWCGGRGQNPGSTRSRFGTCRHCRGQPRVRFGATLVHPELKEKKR
jgi:hypothetical protein